MAFGKSFVPYCFGLETLQTLMDDMIQSDTMFYGYILACFRKDPPHWNARKWGVTTFTSIYIVVKSYGLMAVFKWS